MKKSHQEHILFPCGYPTLIKQIITECDIRVQRPEKYKRPDKNLTNSSPFMMHWRPTKIPLKKKIIVMYEIY